MFGNHVNGVFWSSFCSSSLTTAPTFPVTEGSSGNCAVLCCQLSCHIESPQTQQKKSSLRLVSRRLHFSPAQTRAQNRCCSWFCCCCSCFWNWILCFWWLVWTSCTRRWSLSQMVTAAAASALEFHCTRAALFSLISLLLFSFLAHFGCPPPPPPPPPAPKKMLQIVFSVD